MAHLSDYFDNVQAEAAPVLDRSAILIRALVHAVLKELRDQVPCKTSVHTVDVQVSHK